MGVAGFEVADAGRVGVERPGYLDEGEAGLFAPVAQTRWIRGGVRVGRQLVDLARGVAFEASEDLAAGFAFFRCAGRRIVWCGDQDASVSWLSAGGLCWPGGARPG